MMFLVILPIFEGFAILLLPLLLGTRELPFPRLGAFSFWAFLFGGLLYYSSALFQLVPDAGWFAYTPLSGPTFSPDLALDFWVLGLGVAEVAAISAAIEFIIGILKMRAPGMTLSRHPAVRLVDPGVLVHDHLRLHAADHRQPAARARPGLRHRSSSTPSWAAARCCGSTCSGSSAIPRCTSSSSRRRASCR